MIKMSEEQMKKLATETVESIRTQTAHMSENGQLFAATLSLNVLRGMMLAIVGTLDGKMPEKGEVLAIVNITFAELLKATQEMKAHDTGSLVH